MNGSTTAIDGQTAYAIGPWDETGRAPLTAAGANLTGMLTAALTGLLNLIQLDDIAGTDGRSAPIRAEAPDPAGLLPELLTALIDRMESLGQAVSAVTVDGVVRSESGFVAWGRAELSADPMGIIQPIEIPEPPRVAETLSGATLSAVIERAGKGV